MTERLSIPDNGGFRHRPEYEIENREMRQYYLADAAKNLDDWMRQPRSPSLKSEGNLSFSPENGSVTVTFALAFEFQDDFYVKYDPEDEDAEPEVIPRNETMVQLFVKRVHDETRVVQEISATFRQYDAKEPDWGYETTYTLFPGQEGEALGVVWSDGPGAVAPDGKMVPDSATSMTIYDCVALSKHIELMNKLEHIYTTESPTSPGYYDQ